VPDQTQRAEGLRLRRFSGVSAVRFERERVACCGKHGGLRFLSRILHLEIVLAQAGALARVIGDHLVKAVAHERPFLGGPEEGREQNGLAAAALAEHGNVLFIHLGHISHYASLRGSNAACHQCTDQGADIPCQNPSTGLIRCRWTAGPVTQYGNDRAERPTEVTHKLDVCPRPCSSSWVACPPRASPLSRPNSSASAAPTPICVSTPSSRRSATPARSGRRRSEFGLPRRICDRLRPPRGGQRRSRRVRQSH